MLVIMTVHEEIALADVAYLAKSLKVVENRLTAFTPRNYVIYMENYARTICG